MMICLNRLFLKSFSANEQLVMLQLLLKADDKGVVEFSDRGISNVTGIPYQQVRTIHKKLIADGTLANAPTNSPTNAATNAKTVFVTICDYGSYNAFNIYSNAPTNAGANALEKEITKEKDKVSPQTPLQTDKENNKEKDITPYNPPSVDEENEKLLSRLSELEKSFSALADENRLLKEDNEKLKTNKKKKDLDFSIVAPEHVETVNLWLQYKKERGESYTPSGFVKMYSKLIRLSGNNPSKALKIIEQSMANNWSGFFDLKQDSLPIGFIQHDDGLEKYKNAETW